MSDNMEYMGHIANAIMVSQDLKEISWKQVSIVFEVDDDGYVTGTYGYAYNGAAAPVAVAPDIDEIEEPVQAYREWLRQDGDKGFAKMLFQFDRENSKVNADFEYDNLARWSVTPANLETVIDELRPRL